VSARHEHLVAGDGNVVRDPHEADVASGTGRVDGLHHGVLGRPPDGDGVVWACASGAAQLASTASFSSVADPGSAV